MAIILSPTGTGQGVLTLSDLKDEVKHALGNRSDTDSRLTRFLNIAQQRVARVKDFEELRQSSDGQFVISTSAVSDKKISFTNLREIYSFRVLDGSQSIKLKQVSVRVFDKTIPEPEYFSRGVPSHYTVWKRILEMWRVPDVAYDYSLRWTAWPTPFNDNSPTITSDYLNKDELLISLATAYAFDSLGKVSDADRKFKLAGTLLVESINMESIEPDLEYAPTRTVFNDAMITPEYWRSPFIMAAE